MALTFLDSLYFKTDVGFKPEKKKMMIQANLETSLTSLNAIHLYVKLEKIDQTVQTS